MSPFLAELVGTMLLVILGDGVVANVLLTHTKGNDSGWIVITTGWALAVTFAVYCVNAYQRRASQSRGHDRAWPRSANSPGAACPATSSPR